MAALRDVTCEMLEAHREEMSPVVERRCRFIVEENERVLPLADALPRGPAAAAALFADSFAGARDLYEIGAPSMPAMMEAMRARRA